MPYLQSFVLAEGRTDWQSKLQLHLPDPACNFPANLHPCSEKWVYGAVFTNADCQLQLSWTCQALPQAHDLVLNTVLLPAGTPLSELSTRAAMVTTMQAMAAVTANSTALPGPCYDLCFPVLEAVLSSSVHTSLHEQALQVMALHVAPGLPLPRRDTLAVLSHVLGVVPAYRYELQTYATPPTAALLLTSQMTCVLTSVQMLSSGGFIFMPAGYTHADRQYDLVVLRF